MSAPIKNENGQMTMEAVLLLVILVGVFTLVHRKIAGGEYLSKIVSGPWGHMQGMISNGVWKAGNSNNMHPNAFDRRATPEPL